MSNGTDKSYFLHDMTLKRRVNFFLNLKEDFNQEFNLEFLRVLIRNALH